MIIYTSDIRQIQKDIENSARVSYDIETTGLDPLVGNILLMQFAPDAAITPFGVTTYVVPVKEVPRADLQNLLKTMATKIVLAHNAIFEVKWTFIHFDVLLTRLYDSMIAEKILNAGLNENRSDLASVSLRLLGRVVPKGLQKSFIGANPDTFEPSQEQIEYAAEDAALLHEIRDIQVDEIYRKNLQETAELEFTCLPIFAKMELRGILLDVEAHRLVIDKYQEIHEVNAKIALDILTPYWEVVEAKQRNIDYDKYVFLTEQIVSILEPYGGRLHKDVPKEIRLEVETIRKLRKKPKPTRNLELSKRLMVLDALKEAGITLPNLQAGTIHDALRFEYPDHPVLKAYAWWARANKILTTYGNNLAGNIHPVTGRIHPEYNQVVSTGRTSSSGPNAQNIPPEIRNCFIPGPGRKLVIVDASAMELRAAAALSQDPVMLDAFEKGIDLHKLTAANAWPERYSSWEDVDKDSKDRAIAKTTNFSVIYGGSAEALFFKGIIDDLKTAKEVVAGIKKAYPTMTEWVTFAGRQAVIVGYALTSLGRRRFFPVLPHKPTDRESKKLWYKTYNKMVREASNHPVQGSCSDNMKRAMYLIDRELPPDCYLCCFVHDELVYDVPEHYAEDIATLVLEKIEEAGATMFKGVRMLAESNIKDYWQK